ncbi:ankyrin repeat-containing domain protein [Jimgerdemannia flammicorona]|uniref:Ankyrin repeat-containing domain protein n=1 Tax=Jimgerdemannia flammicorona TaxID=994334 RepID=A0A433DBY9_9FUNG|nr:ankyrin repeat-containing domain protein [Jimgerdemannia flammicorona]
MRVRRSNGYIAADELVHIAAGSGDIEAIDLLTSEEFEASPTMRYDETGWEPIHEAAQGGHIGVLNWLLAKYQVDVNSRTENLKMTLLHIAARYGQPGVVRLLSGRMGPQTNNVEETIWELINIGCDVNMKDKESWSPLHMAAATGRLENVVALIRHGANVNSKCQYPYGATPLFLARTIRKLQVTKKEKDQYAKVMKQLKLAGARDRNLFDMCVSFSYPTIFKVRTKLESLATDLQDKEWLEAVINAPVNAVPVVDALNAPVIAAPVVDTLHAPVIA